MILDRTWNKKEQKLTISYIDKLGNRKFFQKYLHHIKSYEYDDNGEFNTWDGRKCNKIFKDTSNYTPNDFELLEFMYELPEDLNKEMHAQNFPKLYFFDIETEVSEVFPDPNIANQKVTAISLVGPDLSCIVYGLKNLNQEQIERFKKRYLDWLDNNEFAKNLIIQNKWKPKVLYQYFENEEDMLSHFFTVIVPKIACLAGWNSYGFDWKYLTKRISNLFGEGVARNMIYKSSPTHEIKQYSYDERNGKKGKLTGPSHSIILDYMKVVEKYDYILRPYESYSLDWVGSHAVNAHKIKYDGTLQQLYERDPEWYYFYNAIDSCIGELIHYKLKALESPCAVSSVTLVPLLEAFGQVALGTANVFEDFYEHNMKIVWNYDAIERVKQPYDGAFCGCVPGRYTFNVCDDFASLYPSQVRTCNFSFENIVENKIGPDSLGRYTTIPWNEEELENFRKDPNYFVTIMGNVYRNDKDYSFKRIQTKLKKGRDSYKYTGQRIDSEFLVEINNLINSNKGNKESIHQDVWELINKRFPNKDIYSMSKDELIKFKIEIEDLRHEYSLIELAMKLLGNGLYGCCASPYFYFFNVHLAGDITGECRNLTKTMNKNLIEWFHEGIWERKDLWKKFDFELDESKHDWYREQPVWIYSDTDSSYVTYGNFFKAMTKEYQEKYKTNESKVKWILKYNQEFQDKLNNKWCEDIYGPRHGKNVHEFELETISLSGIYLKKKKYLKGLAYNKGVFMVDHPKVSGTGIELIKSTTPKLCREILKDLMQSLMFEYDEDRKKEYIFEFNNKLANYRKMFYNAPIEDISQSIGVGDYMKYVIDDTNNLIFEKQCPVSVHAIARFNYLAHQNNQDNLKQYSGKIKYYNIALGKTGGYFGYPAGELPSWAPKMDKIKQWEKTIIDPINRFLEVMNIPLVNAGTAQQMSLFDF